MNVGLFVWLSVATIGGVLGLFLRPVTIAKVGCALFVAAIGGLILSEFTSNENWWWFFGIASMVVPLVTAVAAGSAFAVGALKQALSRNKSQ